jgi:hypothetical protein
MGDSDYSPYTRKGAIDDQRDTTTRFHLVEQYFGLQAELGEQFTGIRFYLALR